MCRGTLRLEPFCGDVEVEEGKLSCEECRRIYPIIADIPRLLPDELAHVVPEFHAQFFSRHRKAMEPFLARCRRGSRSAWWQVKRRTLKSFSYQWRKFKQMFPQWEETFRWSISPLNTNFFRGKVGLDAGCGFGRSLYYAASFGAEVIGMDLSEAVEAARENTRHLPTAHVIQADIFHPPLQERSLDFVYSIGVLHHLPDPQRGFLTLASLLAPGAPIAIWVYHQRRGPHIPLMTILRAVSRYLPLRLLNLLCLGLAAGQWAMWLAPYHLLSRFSLTRRVVQGLPFTFYAKYPFRVLHTDWFDGLSVPIVNYYRREEIKEWFREGKLRVCFNPDWAGRALGYAPLR
jgi:SAM-dependent methyltransferase